MILPILCVNLNEKWKTGYMTHESVGYANLSFKFRFYLKHPFEINTAKNGQIFCFVCPGFFEFSSWRFPVIGAGVQIFRCSHENLHTHSDCRGFLVLRGRIFGWRRKIIIFLFVLCQINKIRKI